MAFHGKVALITGAGSGMGQIAARRIAEQGAKVAALDVNEEGLRQTASGYDNVRNFAVDVTNMQAVDAAVKEIETDLGPIDRVMNAAAIMPTARLIDQSREEMHRIMDINYGGLVNVTMATLPGMIERGSGDMVNFASMAGWLPAPDMGAYHASKFAVVAFCEVLYWENRNKGVRFACVCPPVVNTPLLEQARSNPNWLSSAPRIEPEVVLDAIEKSLEKGELFVFPGRGTKIAWRLRRWFPGLIWSNFKRSENL
jgi:NAD(P)-dependent dehydrogenase (short-subunit alcohol dehydrogenase family)